MANGSYPTSTSLAETQDECSPRRFFSKHASAVSLYVARILVALVVLCLDAYAIHLSGDLAMVYSLVLAISTILVCAYSIACMRFFRHYYNLNFHVGLQWCFIFFWLVDLGLVGARAHQWQKSKCSNMTTLEYHMHCAGVGGMHVLQNGSPNSSIKTYTGVLVAGAVLAAFQVTFWVITTILFIRSTRKVGEILPCRPATQMPPSQPRRMEAWETSAAEAPRLQPQPILPDSDEQDNASTGPASSSIARDGVDATNCSGHVVAQYVAQQAVQPHFDPYVRHVPLRQTPLRYWSAPLSEHDEEWEWDGRGSLRMVDVLKEDLGCR